MNICVRYYTRSGNTKKLAEAFADATGVKAFDVTEPLSEKADILFIGCSYYGFDIDEAVKKFLRENKDKIGTVVAFGTSAMMKSTIKPLKKVTDELGINLKGKDFHCRGSFGVFHKGHPNEKDLENAAIFAKQAVEEI